MNRGLLFDFDGVIVDSEAIIGQALIDICAEDGVHLTFDHFGHLLGMTGPDNDRQWDEFIRHHLGDVDRDAFGVRLRERVAPHWAVPKLLPGVRELIDAARGAAWRTGLGTGNEGDVDLYLERLGLADAFDAIARTHGTDIPSKPAPDVFLVLAERLRVDARDCVVIEDSVAGCEAALAAGMHVIACPSIATRGCAFPDGIRFVGSLLDIEL